MTRPAKFRDRRWILLFLWHCLVRKNFQDSLSHQIFSRMHGALNIDENKNLLRDWTMFVK